MKKIALD